jgi:hypothetical protein
MVPKAKKDYLWLVWKDVETRERFVVGELSWNGETYNFEYINNEGDNNLTKALERGFELLPAFPEITKEYKSPKLFITFSNRLPDRNRKDVITLLQRKGLSLNCSDIEFLKLTGGRLPTDTLEFVQEIEQVEKDFIIQFYIAGARYYLLEKIEPQLNPGTQLKLRTEPTNEYDSHAIEVMTLNDEKLGYVPVFYSRYLDREVEQGLCLAKVISFNNEADFNEKLEIEVSGKSSFTDIIESLDKERISD